MGKIIAIAGGHETLTIHRNLVVESIEEADLTPTPFDPYSIPSTAQSPTGDHEIEFEIKFADGGFRWLKTIA